MELDFSQMALEVSHHGYLLVTHLTTQEHCCHTSFHAYWYMNVMRSSRLFRVSLFLENGSILMIWGCFSIVSNVIRSNYCCRRHTMHGNMVFSRDLFSLPHNKADVYMCAALDQLKAIYANLQISSVTHDTYIRIIRHHYIYDTYIRIIRHHCFYGHIYYLDNNPEGTTKYKSDFDHFHNGLE